MVQFQGACVAEGSTMLVTEFMEVCCCELRCMATHHSPCAAAATGLQSWYRHRKVVRQHKQLQQRCHRACPPYEPGMYFPPCSMVSFCRRIP